MELPWDEYGLLEIGQIGRGCFSVDRSVQEIEELLAKDSKKNIWGVVQVALLFTDRASH